MIAALNKQAESYKKNNFLSTESFFGIHGKFIPAKTIEEDSQQRNILPKIEGEEGDPKLTFGPEEPKRESTDENNEQHKNSAEVKDLIGDVLHFDENMINHHSFPAVARHLPDPSDQHDEEGMENEPENEENDTPLQQEGAEEDDEKPKETVETNDYSSIDKEEYTTKGREETMQFNKFMNQIQEDPGMESSFRPTNQMEYKEYKSPQKLQGHRGLPMLDSYRPKKLDSPPSVSPSGKKASCPHPRCDIDEDFEGHFEPPGDEEVPYEGKRFFSVGYVLIRKNNYKKIL